MTNRSTARDAIEQTLSAWAAAIRDADLDALGALVTEDAEFWTHGAPPLNGRRELIEAFEPFFAQFEMQQDFTCQELVVLEEHAFMRGFEVNRLVPRDGGETVEVRQRAFSLLCRGRDGKWRFARGMTNLDTEATGSRENLRD